MQARQSHSNDDLMTFKPVTSELTVDNIKLLKALGQFGNVEFPDNTSIPVVLKMDESALKTISRAQERTSIVFITVYRFDLENGEDGKPYVKQMEAETFGFAGFNKINEKTDIQHHKDGTSILIHHKNKSGKSYINDPSKTSYEYVCTTGALNQQASALHKNSMLYIEEILSARQKKDKKEVEKNKNVTMLGYGHVAAHTMERSPGGGRPTLKKHTPRLRNRSGKNKDALNYGQYTLINYFWDEHFCARSVSSRTQQRYHLGRSIPEPLMQLNQLIFSELKKQNAKHHNVGKCDQLLAHPVHEYNYDLEKEFLKIHQNPSALNQGLMRTLMTASGVEFKNEDHSEYYDTTPFQRGNFEVQRIINYINENLDKITPSLSKEAKEKEMSRLLNTKYTFIEDGIEKTRTPLQHAAVRGNFEGVVLLMKYGADHSLENLSKEDQQMVKEDIRELLNKNKAEEKKKESNNLSKSTRPKTLIVTRPKPSQLGIFSPVSSGSPLSFLSPQSSYPLLPTSSLQSPTSSLRSPASPLQSPSSSRSPTSLQSPTSSQSPTSLQSPTSSSSNNENVVRFHK